MADRWNFGERVEEEEEELSPLPQHQLFSAEGRTLTDPDDVERRSILPGLEEFFVETARGVTIGARDIAEILATTSADPISEFFMNSAVQQLSGVGTEEGESLGGSMVREVARFGTGFSLARPIVAGVGIKGAVMNPMVAGFVTDMTMYGPYEERFSNLVAELPEGTQLEVARQVALYLRADPDDEESLARFKQGVEGILLGPFADVTLRTIAATRGIPGRIVRFGRQELLRARAQRAGANMIEEAEFPTSGSMLDPITTPDVHAALEAEELLRKEFSELGLPDPGEGVGRVSIPGLDLEKMTVTEARAEILTREFGNRIRPLLRDGQITQENFDAKLSWFRRNAVNILRRDTEVEGAEVVERFMDSAAELRALVDRNVEESRVSLTQWLEKRFSDRTARLRESIGNLGAAGQMAMMRFDLSAGANPRSTVEFARSVADIYKTGRGPLGHTYIPQDDIDMLNMIIAGRRMREIRRYRLNLEETGEGLADADIPGFESRLLNTVGEAQAMFQNLRDTLGETKFNDLWSRADRFFEVTQQKTDELLEGGLISVDAHRRLSHFDYAPIEYLNKMDPIVVELPGEQGRTISVTTSGIARLEQGSVAPLEMDFESLLGQIIYRTNASVARNRANQTLLQVASANDNPIVRTQVPKEDRDLYTKISAFVDGERKDFFLRSTLAEEWAIDPLKTHMVMQLVSGSAFVRPMATGLNPEFAIANLPRDLMLIWLQSDLYNQFAPRAIGQMASDLAVTAKDAFTRSGRYNEAMEEGLLMSFLTHQGQFMRGDIGRAPHGLRQVWTKFQDVAGYLGETTELWTRLAVRERELANLTIRNRGIELPEFREMATHRARNYLDYHQGGTWTKAADTAFPYLNAGSQGIRSFVRATVDDPIEMGIKLTQLAGIYAGLNLANRLYYPEAWDDVPPEVKAGYMVMMTGMRYRDERGEMRHIYYRIPVDHSTVWLKGTIDALFDSQISGRRPDDAMIEQIKASLNSSLGLIPGLSQQPLTNAVLALVGNTDSFGREIWRGSPVLSPELQYYQYPSRSTSPLAIEFGAMVNQSPAQLEAALRSVLPSNIYTNLVNQGFTLMTEGVPQEVLDAEVPQLLTMMPGSRRVLGVTHPFTRERTLADTLSTEQADRGELVKRELDEMTFRSFTQPGSISEDTIRQFIRNQRSEEDPFFEEKLSERYDDLTSMLRIFERRDYDSVPNMPGRSFWFDLQGRDPRTRAIVFAEQWDMTFADPDPRVGATRRELLRLMIRDVPGFDSNPRGRSQEFAHWLRQERTMREGERNPTW